MFNQKISNVMKITFFFKFKKAIIHVLCSIKMNGSKLLVSLGEV